MPITMTPVSIKALKLPAKQRMGLASLLIDSLEPTSDMDKKLLRELTKRAQDIRSGKIKGMSTEEAYGFSL